METAHPRLAQRLRAWAWTIRKLTMDGGVISVDGQVRRVESPTSTLTLCSSHLIRFWDSPPSTVA
jgi:hypothetical protein